MTRAKADLLQGTLDLLILKALTLGALHGWGISKRIRDMSKGLLEVTSVPHFQDHASDNWEPEGAGSDGVVNRSWSGRRSNMLSWSTCSIW